MIHNNSRNGHAINFTDETIRRRRDSTIGTIDWPVSLLVVLEIERISQGFRAS